MMALLYFATAALLLLLAARFVAPLSHGAALVLLLLPLLFTGRAVFTGGVYAPVELPYEVPPLSDYRQELGVPPVQNPVLTDIAYLIFLSYIMFTMRYAPAANWGETVTAAQLQHETARIAGILLIIGLLHGINLLALPVMGRLLTLNRQLDESTPP